MTKIWGSIKSMKEKSWSDSEWLYPHLWYDATPICHQPEVSTTFLSHAHFCVTTRYYARELRGILVIRACLITLHSNFEIFQKGHPAVVFMLDRRIFER